MSAAIALRNTLQPGDLGQIVHLHGVLYAREYGFDITFEAYVAQPLAEFVRDHTDRERIWIAEREGRIVGSVAIVAGELEFAQLRWFLVHPQARGAGLGGRLLREAVGFARCAGYRGVFLWTVSALTAAARLYTRCGFAKDQEQRQRLWGVDVLEERYTLSFCATDARADLRSGDPRWGR